MVLLLVLALSPVLALASDRIDVQIGGLMSGPSRRTLDIGAAKLSMSNGTRQQPGPTRIISLDRCKVDALKGLAVAVLATGPETALPCSPNADRMIGLDIAVGARKYAGPVYCPSRQTSNLVDAMYDIPAAPSGPSGKR